MREVKFDVMGLVVAVAYLLAIIFFVVGVVVILEFIIGLFI